MPSIKRVTIKDIARITGYSHPTVSRVLNNKGKYYSDKTAEKIIKAAKQLNYTPNSAARSLKFKRTKLIALLIPGDQASYLTIYRGINKVASEKGYNTSVFISYYNENKEQENIKTLISNRVEGVIMSPIFVNNKHIELLQECGIPVVIVDRENKFKGVSNVAINNFEATYNSTKYLIDKGYKKIYYISGPLEDLSYKRRFQGFKEALKENRIKFDKSMTYFFQDFYWLKGEYDKTYRTLENIINNYKNIDSLFIVSTTLPILSLKIIYDLNLKIPDDLAILGFNELAPISEYAYTPITTISSPMERMGVEAMEILHKMIENHKYHKYLELKPILNLRSST